MAHLLGLEFEVDDGMNAPPDAVRKSPLSHQGDEADPFGEFSRSLNANGVEYVVCFWPGVPLAVQKGVVGGPFDVEEPG